jgi:cellulose synthase/poly-beta-1,6-N-acetylglucosamine synthase-like glycosyltransferase
MNGPMLLALAAFGASLVLATVLGAWRQRLAQARTAAGAPHGTPRPVSFLVPVRDGGEDFTAVLQDLHAQCAAVPGSEVIVIDDHSTDGTRARTEAMAARWPALRCIPNNGEGKKAAITTGVHHARHELVLLTDADAHGGRERALCVAAHHTRTPWDMLVLPVRTLGDGTFTGWLQAEEQVALQGVALGAALSGAPLLANGANMAFTRAAFHAVGGYQGDRFASGDDQFLLERMRRAGNPVACLADPAAMVTVACAPGLRAAWRQRLRWAGKMRGAGVWGALPSALAVLHPWALLLLTLCIHWTDTVNQGLFRSILLLAGAWLLWLLPVLLLVGEAKRFFGERPTPLRSLTALLLFSVYAPVVALASLVVRPQWKGRRV